MEPLPYLSFIYNQGAPMEPSLSLIILLRVASMEDNTLILGISLITISHHIYPQFLPT